MSTEDLVYDLVAEWDRRQQDGEDVSAEIICGDHPELAPMVAERIVSVKKITAMMPNDQDDEDDYLSLPDFAIQSTEQDDAADVTTALSLDDFESCVTSAGLMTAEQLSSFQSGLTSPVDATGLARQLVRQRRLTRFQAEALCDGKGEGLVYGDYVILDRIGAGGMGQVFKARHRRMKRVVALKILPPETVASPNAVERFEREVEAAARLIHPNIVTAYDAREDNGVHYLVMECVDGSDLSSIVKTNGPLSVAKSVDYIRQAATGLAFAHSKGVVHRDIKPANLLVDGEGVVKILDMGLARVEQSTNGNGHAVTQAEITQDGSVFGTVDYMAPEQALDTKTADARADIYSLGCTLHYLLTGQPVYRGTSLMAKMMAHKEADIPVLDEQREGVPAELSAVFEKMLAKEPDDRYQTAAALLADLEDVADGSEDEESAMDAAPPQETALEVQSKETASASFDQTIDLQDAAGNADDLLPLPVGEGRGEGSPADSSPHPRGHFETGIREGEAPAEPSFPVVSARQEPRPPGFETASNLLPNGEGTFATRSKTRVDWRILAGGVVAVLALAFVGWLYHAGIIFKVELAEGIIRIETNVPDVDVFVDNERAIRLTYSKDRKTIEVTVKPGAKTLSVSKDGFEAEVTEFSLKTQKGPIEVTFEPVKPDPVKPDKKQMPTPVDGDMDREVAEWALSVGGRVSVSTGPGQGVSTSKVDDLPKEAFSVVGIILRLTRGIQEEDYIDQFTKLQHLKGLDALWLPPDQSVSDRVLETIASHWSSPPGTGRLWIDGTSITDAGLKHLSEMPNLGQLDLTGLEITDAGLKHVGTLPNLVHLSLGGTKITDDGIEHLVHLPLTHLTLGACPEITDRALQYASNWPNLYLLELTETRVTDAGLQHLEGLEKLAHLWVARTNVSTAGVERLLGKLPAIEWITLGDVTKLAPDHEGLARLQKVRPHCKIGMLPVGSGFPNPVLWRAFWVLWLDGSLEGAVEGGEPIEISNVEAAPDNLHRIISINFDDNQYLNDACAERFKSYRGLQRLSLRNTNLTNDAVDDLKSLKALEEMDLTGTKITAYGITVIKAALPNCKVVWEGDGSDQGE